MTCDRYFNLSIIPVLLDFHEFLILHMDYAYILMCRANVSELVEHLRFLWLF